MPTVAIDVADYKRLVERMLEIYCNFHPDQGIDIFMDEFGELPLPDYVCDKCGHESSKLSNGEACPRCGEASTITFVTS